MSFNGFGQSDAAFEITLGHLAFVLTTICHNLLARQKRRTRDQLLLFFWDSELDLSKARFPHYCMNAYNIHIKLNVWRRHGLSVSPWSSSSLLTGMLPCGRIGEWTTIEEQIQRGRDLVATPARLLIVSMGGWMEVAGSPHTSRVDGYWFKCATNSI